MTQTASGTATKPPTARQLFQSLHYFGEYVLLLESFSLQALLLLQHCFQLGNQLGFRSTSKPSSVMLDSQQKNHSKDTEFDRPLRRHTKA